MKSITAGVTWNVLASVLAIVLFGVLCAEGTIQHAKSTAVGAGGGERVLQADGNAPPPPPILPGPKAIA